MIRALAVAGLLLFATAGCGDGTRRSEGATTTTGGSPSQPHCGLKSEAPPDGYVKPDASARNEALAPDVDVIRAYGQAHPDEFTSVGYEYNVGQRILVYFTDHLDEHRAAIAHLVAHPNDFDVLEAPLSARRSAEIADAIQADDGLRPEAASVTYGTANGAVTASFRSTETGRAAADRAHNQWGDDLCVEIAGHPYPKGAWTDASSCQGDAPSYADNSDVELRLELQGGEVARGAIVEGSLFVTNKGTRTLSWPGGSSLGASVLDGAHHDVVGGNASLGGSDAMAVDWTAQPGQTIMLPVRFGTDDCRPNHDYALPPGTYDVVTGLPDAGVARAVMHIENPA